MSITTAYEEYRKVHRLLSGEVEKELARFARETDENYIVALLPLKVCECGKKFLPNKPNNIWCSEHAGAINYNNKMKSFKK